MIEATAEDLFGDIGSGIRNIVVQVALQSPVHTCVGVELRRDIASLAEWIVADNSAAFPALNRVCASAGDIRSLSPNLVALLGRCTIIFTNNLLFDEDTHAKLDEVVCRLSSATKLIVGKKFCFRHRNGCTREFCSLWTFREELSLPVN